MMLVPTRRPADTMATPKGEDGGGGRRDRHRLLTMCQMIAKRNRMIDPKHQLPMTMMKVMKLTKRAKKVEIKVGWNPI